MFQRVLDLEPVLNRKSLFLLGPRLTGKSTLLTQKYSNELVLNLLDREIYQKYISNLKSLSNDIDYFERKNKKIPLVIIDEIQKIPQLLDEVHLLIEKNKKIRFILTGSSARKLKKAGVNLLGGRASWCSMFPLVYPEICEQLTSLDDLVQRITKGGLPQIFLSDAFYDDLKDYIHLYLNEEIKAEGIVRSIENFHRFLAVAALTNAKQINFTEVGKDSQIPPRTIIEYYKILEDTLVGSLVEPYRKTIKRTAVSVSKFYFFDTGVLNALLGRRSISAQTTEFGDLLEQFIYGELKAKISYRRTYDQIFYWRSVNKQEVDFIIQHEDQSVTLIEVKSKAQISSRDLNGIKAFCEEKIKVRKKILICTSQRPTLLENVEILPVLDFLKEWWA
jgi:predicted AAA+ superfamily ATPase